MNDDRCPAAIQITTRNRHSVNVRCELAAGHDNAHSGHALPGTVAWDSEWVVVQDGPGGPITEFPNDLRILP